MPDRPTEPTTGTSADPPELEARSLSEILQELAQLSQAQQGDASEMRSAVSELSRALAKLFEMIRTDRHDQRARISQLERELAAARAQLAALGVEPAAVPAPNDFDQLRAAAERLLPGARLLEGEEWLRGYDRYYYAREAHTMTGQRERPLPALRLRLDDVEQYWVVLDPATGAIVQLSNRRQRAERWLFAFLHSFDLPPFLNARPLWDGWMLGFSLSGLALSLSGVVMGWRRLRRKRGGRLG